GYACEFPGVKVTVAVNGKMVEKAPEVVAFLKNYQTSTKINSELLAFMQDHGADIDKTVTWFFSDYEDLWTSWIPQEVAAVIRENINPDQTPVKADFTKFPATLSFSLGIYVEKVISWLTENFQSVFDWLKFGVNGIVSSIKKILAFIPWFILIAFIFLLGWKVDQWKSGLLYALMAFFIG
ncbi:MAG TPA: hypothetical protein DDZ91_12800, partial [Firmicutes bacterium]|nr:hypothetical protein [Bacillota bacterium]